RPAGRFPGLRRCFPGTVRPDRHRPRPAAPLRAGARPGAGPLFGQARDRRTARHRDRLTGPEIAPFSARLFGSSLMRLALLAATAFGLVTATAAQAQTPPDRWHARAREIYEHAISIATVQGRGQVPALAQYLQEQFRAGGLDGVTIHPYDVVRPDDHTAALILRWPAARPSNRKAMLIMAHMDVVEARRADWSRDPFQLGE